MITFSKMFQMQQCIFLEIFCDIMYISIRDRYGYMFEGYIVLSSSFYCYLCSSLLFFCITSGFY